MRRVSGRIIYLLLRYATVIISLIITVGIILLAFGDFEKYQITKIRQLKHHDKKAHAYHDLNGDGVSEEIVFLILNHRNLTGIQVYKGEEILDQWNFEGVANSKHLNYFFGDYDRNGFKEIYMFNYYHDSIYLNIIEPFPDKQIQISDSAYDQYRKPIINTPSKDFNINSGSKVIDTDNSAEREICFALHSGGYVEPYQPRRVCIYDIPRDSLLFSAKGGVNFTKLHIIDLDNDGDMEITGKNTAFGNLPVSFPYTDMKGWLMVFDHHLNFVFEPVAFNEYPMRLNVLPFKPRGHQEQQFFVHQNYYGLKDIASKLFIIDNQGNILHKKEIPQNQASKQSKIISYNNRLYFLDKKSTIRQYDHALQLKRKWKIDNAKGGVHYKGNFDGDDHSEFIFHSLNYQEFIITDHQFQHPVAFKVPYERIRPRFMIKVTESGQHLIYAETPVSRGLYKYEQNPMFILQYPMYIGLFGAVWLFVFAIKRIQTLIVKRTYETRQKMTELQLKSVKNQIQPHFTFNLLNSISSLLYKEDFEKANFITEKYAKLLRQTLMHSDRSIISLADEMQYVRNYLEIEKHRFGSGFSYHFQADDDIDMEIQVPKMLVFTFVENAVKHGIRPLDGNGHVDITLSLQQTKYVIEIADNGIGMQKAQEYSAKSTKMGIKTVDKILLYYRELKKRAIYYELSALNPNFAENKGTKVKIFIPAS